MFNAISHNVLQLPVSEKKTRYQSSSIFELASTFGLEDLHFKQDLATGLQAIVAIHNTSRGPALGGTRCMSYATESAAIVDVIRLAQGMSYKSAFAHMPYGGGKAVLIRPHQILNRDAYFESFGKFLNTLNGRFITAVDVGTGVDDMDRIAHCSPFVKCTSNHRGDPSGDTAKGVLNGIKAAIKVCLQHDDLHDVRIAIQGVGKVGTFLAELLHQEGAKLIVSDINHKSAEYCAQLFGAEIVSPEQIYSVHCDVFSPCALGGSLNANTMHLINARIICGSANNQLASISVGDSLHQKQIFLVPDYVVNVGGLIHIVIESNAEAQTKVSEIYDAVIDIYRRSQKNNIPSQRSAIQMVEQILSQAKPHGNNPCYVRGLT
jgi:leucine dehydrogenase